MLLMKSVISERIEVSLTKAKSTQGKPFSKVRLCRHLLCQY